MRAKDARVYEVILEMKIFLHTDYGKASGIIRDTRYRS